MPWHGQLGTLDLLDVCACADGRFVAVGRSGVVWLRHGHGDWRALTTGFHEDLYAVCRSATGWTAVGGDLDIGGQSKVLECDGEQCLVRQSGVQSILLAVDGNEDEMWACGFNGDIVRRAADGNWAQCTELDQFEHLFAVSVTPDAVLLAGMNGRLHRREASGQWTSSRLGAEHVFAIASDADGSCCAVGARGFRAILGQRATADGPTLQCVCRAHGWWYAAGAHGLIASYDESLDLRPIAGPPDSHWHGIAASHEVLVVVGAKGRVVELLASEGSFQYNSAPTFERAERQIPWGGARPSWTISATDRSTCR